MSPPPDYDPREPSEALLAESSWLRALARRLVNDPERAEDAVQDTWIAAMERPPRRGTSPRAWLATVLRNRLRQDQRATARRKAREAVVRRSADGPSPSDIAERLALQRQVVDAVESLEEPYRTTVVLRFLDGLSPREVAKRTKVPVKTVHTRIDRAIPRLRSKLDRSSSRGREAWLSAMMPLALPVSALPASLGVLWMSTKMKWAGVAVLTALVGVAVTRGVDASGGEDPQAPLAAADADETTPMDAAPEPVEPVAAAVPNPERVELVAAVDPPEASPDVASQPTFSGRVLDMAGEPVAGLLVEFEPTSRPSMPRRVDDPPVRSDASGRFVMALPGERGRLVASSDEWASVVRPGVHEEAPPEPPVIVVAPSRDYAGLVVDGAGLPLAGVEVSVQHSPSAELTRIAGYFGRSVPIARTSTLDDGSFSFVSIGWVDGGIVHAGADGYWSQSEPLPPRSTSGLNLVLVRREGVAGRVVDASGDPVEGAYVALDGREAMQTGVDGTFVLDPPDGDSSSGQHTLRAAKAGLLPAALDLSEHELASGGPVLLVLDETALTIEGTVLDASGRAVEGALIWTFDGEPFGQIIERFGELNLLLTRDLEHVLAGEVGGGHGPGREAKSDEGGHFSLRGLVDRGYTIAAMHPSTQEIVRLADVRAGSAGLSLRFHGDERTAPVAGVVTNLAGQPIEGALIRVARVVPGDSEGRQQNAPREFFATTDETGRFRFETLAIEGTTLFLNGEDIPVAQRRSLGDVDDIEDVSFRVPAACWLRVVIEGDPEPADALSVLDEEGNEIDLVVKAGSVTLGCRTFSFEHGTSDVVKLDERGVTLVLYRGNDEVQRIAIELEPGKVTEIRP